MIKLLRSKKLKRVKRVPKIKKFKFEDEQKTLNSALQKGLDQPKISQIPAPRSTKPPPPQVLRESRSPATQH